MNNKEEGIIARLEFEGPIDRLYELLAIINGTNHAPQFASAPTKVTGVENGPPVSPDQPISEKQAKRVYAIALSNDYSEEEMNSILKKEFGYGSTWAIKNRDYEAVCARLATKP